MSNYFKLVHKGDYSQKQTRSFMTAIDSTLGFPERAGSRVRTGGVNEKCLLSYDGWDPKPAFYAYQNLCGVMDHRYARKTVDHRFEITDPGIFYGIGPNDDAFPSIPLLASFKSEGGGYLLAYCLPWQAQEYLPEFATITLRTKEITFEDPVLINPMSREVFKVGMDTEENDLIFRGLPLADYPFIIAERNEIDL